MRVLEEESKSGNSPASKREKLRKAQAKRDEYLSKALVKRVSKPCPHCKVPIEKDQGLVCKDQLFRSTSLKYLTCLLKTFII